MSPHDDSDWSDSDDDGLSEIETAVLLGLPDDAIEKKGDIDDAAVSRIGGYPVRRLAFIPLDRVPNSNILFFLALAVSLSAIQSLCANQISVTICPGLSYKH